MLDKTFHCTIFTLNFCVFKTMYILLFKNPCHVLAPNVTFIYVSWYNEIHIVTFIRCVCIMLKILVYQGVFPTRKSKSNSNDLKP